MTIRIVAIALTVLVAYVAVAALAFGFQRRIFYPAPADGAAQLRSPGPGFERITVATDDGLALGAHYRPARGDMPTIVFFHGNGDSVASAREATAGLAGRGYGVLLAEYRGYAGNPGAPTEAGLYRDGRASLDWLARRGIASDRIVVIGNSIGSGIATQLAAERPVRALVLVSPFTSLADVAVERLHRLLPGWLVRDRYDNAAKLARVTAPVLLLHGDGDTLIPASHARRLAGLRAATLVVVPGRGHELAYLPDTQTRIAGWLDSL